MAISKEEYILLRRPFDLDSISFKPLGSGDNVRFAAHADLRSYQERLNELFPNEWESYTSIYTAEDRIICVTDLIIRGIRRGDVGEGLLTQGQTRTDANAATSAKAQSFKRACVNYGLGEYLYQTEDMWGKPGRYGRPTDSDLEKFRNILSDDDYRFWAALQENNIDLMEAAKRLASGKTMVEVFKELK